VSGCGWFGDLVGTEGGLDECDVQPTPMGVQEVTNLGFAASDILEFAEGTHRGPLVWYEHDPPVVVGPETGQSEIELIVTHGNREVRGYDTESSALDCSNVEIDVGLSLRSAGGALDEQLEGTLLAYEADWASLNLDIELSDLTGTLYVDGADPELSRHFSLETSFTPSTFWGSLSGQSQQDQDCSGDSCSGAVAVLLLADWGRRPGD
jgi:hypothetical protein